ncbi:U-scoloptoxin(19)-Sm1a isoform X1 [Wyeomyia smithii]|uniref:U-scoloptoxin(19)-Sm1a isoform X1 n=1 Tax=Wyeomyia smithii TaxID=174621 RepID=UPI002467F631|nr:U-scoloptoxin(19)-Sm1a isoform X1 [Wyeomyia smithii]
MNVYPMTLLLLVVASVYACSGAEIALPSVHENGDEALSYLGVTVYKVEDVCARQGGLCVHKSDCQSPTTKKGLCPENAHRGVECCYEVRPPKGLTCRRYQGECVEWCHPVYRVPAKDCGAGKSCCTRNKK